MMDHIFSPLKSDNTNWKLKRAQHAKEKNSNEIEFMSMIITGVHIISICSSSLCVQQDQCALRDYTCNFLRNGVLDLQPRVNLHEVMFPCETENTN